MDSENFTDNHADNMISADRPIESTDEDRLGRKKFAEQLALTLLNWQAKDSLVVGIYGRWGTGKTSLMNMVLSLLKDDKRCPHVVHFNPWSWSDSEWLNRKFFWEIAACLKKSDEDIGKDIAKSLREFAELLSSFDKRTEILFKILTRHRLKRISANGVDDLKSNLAKKMNKLRRPVLVVIDDVDRLSPKEIAEVFKLIKCNADFPNTIYAVLFQRDVIEKQLTSLKYDGHNYIEKIVQIPFVLPTSDQKNVQKILFEKIDVLLEDTQMGQVFDTDRWSDLFLSGFSECFSTPRDVNRYISSLSFHSVIHQGEDRFEVNPVDLLGIEALRVFFPDLFREISLSKQLLTVDCISEPVSPAYGREIEKKVAFLLQLGGKHGKSLVRFLFPMIRNYDSDNKKTKSWFSDDTWYRDLRVCHPEVFDRYFQLIISEGDIPMSTMMRLIESTRKLEKFRAEIADLKSQNLLEVAIYKLKYFLKDIESDAYPNFLFGILELADSVTYVQESLLQYSQHNILMKVLYQNLIQNFNTVDHRSRVLYSAFLDSDSFSLMAKVLFRERRNREDSSSNSDNLLDDNTFGYLKKELLGKINESSIKTPEKFLSIPALPVILSWWSKNSDNEQLRKWSRSIKINRENIFQILRAYHTVSFTGGGGEQVADRKNQYIRIESLNKHFGNHRFETILRNIPDEELSPEEKGLVEIFELSQRIHLMEKDSDSPVFS